MDIKKIIIYTQMNFLKKNKHIKEDSNKHLYIYNKNKIFILLLEMIHITVSYKLISQITLLKSIKIVIKKDNIFINAKDNFNPL